MTPEQQNLDKNIKETDTIKGLQDGQEMIREAIEDEKAQNKIEFEKGSKKFEHLESEMRDMKVQINDGFVKISEDIHKHIQGSQENEIKKLNDKLGKKDQVKNGIIITLVGGILLFLAVEIIKNVVITENSSTQEIVK